MPTTLQHPAPTTSSPTREGVQAPAEAKPILLLFSERTSGPARREEGFVAHALQRRHNHDTFRFRVIDREDRPDLFERFHVREVPTLLVIDDKRVCARRTGFARPSDIEELLEPWLH